MKPSTKVLGTNTIQLLLVTSSQLTLIAANIVYAPQDKKLNSISLPLHSKANNRDSAGNESKITPIPLSYTNQETLPPTHGLSSQRIVQSMKQQLTFNAQRQQFNLPVQSKIDKRPSNRSITDSLRRLMMSSLRLISEPNPIADRSESKTSDSYSDRPATTTVRPTYDQIPRPSLIYVA